MKQIILTRHTEAVHSQAGDGKETFAGAQVNSELTENGRTDAKLIAAKILDLGGIDVIFTSPMIRTRQTAEIISQTLRRLTNKTIPIVSLEELREVNVGQFTGKTRGQVESLFPQPAAHFYAGEQEKYDFPDGESAQQIKQRITQAVQTILKDSQAVNIVIVAHSMVNPFIVEAFKEQVRTITDEHLITIEEENEQRGVWQYKLSVIKPQV